MSHSLYSSEMPYRWYRYLSLTEVLPQLRSPVNRKACLDINPPFKMPSDVESLKTVLDEVADREGISDNDRSRLVREIVANFCSALTTGRHSDKVTILSVGETGQGKSATINKLVGQQLLKVGREQSTTKDIESVVVSAARNGVTVSIAFDDTPGLQDTTVTRRENNAILLQRYCKDSFTCSPRGSTLRALENLLNQIGHSYLVESLKPTLRNHVYPNAIILTTRWDHVKLDAQNDLGHFNTPIGRVIWLLYTSKLFDRKRPNAIITVTRALTDPSDYIDEEQGTAAFNEEWLKESEKVKKMIWDIQEKVFPGVGPWPVVFIENGGSLRKFGKYDFLPNKEQTHQNLFDELDKLFAFEDQHGGRDLLGLQALVTVVSGPAPHARGKLEKQTLQSQLNDGDIVSATERIEALHFIGAGPSAEPLLETSRASSIDDDEATVYSPFPDSPISSRSSISSIGGGLNRRQNAARVEKELSEYHDRFWKQLVGGLVIGGIVIAVGAACCVVQ